MKSPRLVTLNRVGDTLFVMYVARRPRGRHSPAQFSTKDAEKDAREWLATRPDLKLVEDEK